MVKPPRTPEHISQFFGYEHLPVRLQKVSRPFGDLVALRKLLEAKDAAVRAKLARSV